MSSNSTTLSGFRERAKSCFQTKKQQVAFAVLGVLGIAAFITVYFVLYPEIPNHSVLSVVGLAIPFLIGIGFSLFFTALGLFRVETEIDLNTRKASITKKNFRGQKSTRVFDLDTIGIAAIRMGAAPSTASGVSTRERWIVKAGFQNEHYDTAIYSQETADEEERNKVMLDLYRFFFPNGRPLHEDSIQTEGSSAVLNTS